METVIHRGFLFLSSVIFVQKSSCGDWKFTLNGWDYYFASRLTRTGLFLLRLVFDLCGSTNVHYIYYCPSMFSIIIVTAKENKRFIHSFIHSFIQSSCFATTTNLEAGTRFTEFGFYCVWSPNPKIIVWTVQKKLRPTTFPSRSP